ncbi:aminotransferase class I/II-fold pyridoxal phosphate-dependent enzyme [Pseudonocardia sp. C8]|nr:aminotransferase class I/II-fold pyridoxal phosphate-dependent enzyme [Pseudonocardia sp. C8]MBC3193846.1 aminotransferase class I/II-fold pyridoxal phosphate-dependent enzyme [Pseudonocardia sp. C8]
MKWRTHDDDVLPLWVAEADVPLAPAIVDAVTRAVRRGDTGYPAGDGYPTAFARFARDRWGWDRLDPARSLVVPDVMQGIVEALKVVLPPGDAVAVTPPVYPPFYAFLAHGGMQPVGAPLGEDGRLDLAALDAVFADGRVGAFLLCSPHNPTGTVHTAEELAAVADLARRRQVTVVADEIHAPLIDPGTPFTPWLSVPGAENGVSLMSATKAWNLAGLKAAIAVTGPEVDLGRFPAGMLEAGASHVAVQAHVAGLDDGRDWLDEFLAALASHRRLLAALLTEHLPAVRYRPSPATFLAWLDCRQLGLGDDPAAAFLERGRVALNSGLPFGDGGAGHARLNLATSPEILTEAVRRMAAALP